MYDRLVALSSELSRVLDEIEQNAQKDLNESGVRRRQAVTTIERVRIARNVTGEQLALLMREVRVR